MNELYAVYLESLDQNLTVLSNKEEAEELLNKWLSEGKPAKMQIFGSHQIFSLEKANGCSAHEDAFWEELKYDNGSYVLTEHYSWHTKDDKREYYADYILS